MKFNFVSVYSIINKTSKDTTISGNS